MSEPAARSTPWLFSAPVDLAAFGGSALLALLAMAWGWHAGLLEYGDTPEWAWVGFILMIDVAHVYSTAFRVYFDPTELKRRLHLYTLTPVLTFLGGWLLYTESPATFWRCLAYLAVFHFVRQQYGWVALYRSRAGETDTAGRIIDTAAVYLATLYPLVWWHTRLPREFQWFVDGDFAALPEAVARILEPFYWLALVAYALHSGLAWLRGRGNPGKDLVVASTAFFWHVGIITFNSDYAFTVTNVIIHGIPYLVLVYWYAYVRAAAGEVPKVSGAWRHVRTVFLFMATLWFLAAMEELVWNRAIWKEHGWLFGGEWEVGGWDAVLVPLLAVPQATHYVLDGFIWRRRSNPDLADSTASP